MGGENSCCPGRRGKNNFGKEEKCKYDDLQSKENEDPNISKEFCSKYSEEQATQKEKEILKDNNNISFNKSEDGLKKNCIVQTEEKERLDFSKEKPNTLWDSKENEKPVTAKVEKSMVLQEKEIKEKPAPAEIEKPINSKEKAKFNYYSCLFCLPITRKFGMIRVNKRLDITKFPQKERIKMLDSLQEGAMIDDLNLGS